jgi:hypothetical protein
LKQIIESEGAELVVLALHADPVERPVQRNLWLGYQHPLILPA